MEQITDSSMNGVDLVGSADESTKTLSLMAGVVGPEGLPEAQQTGIDGGKLARGKLFTQGTMLIIIVCLIAAGALVGMRLSQRDVGPSTRTKNVEAKIDQALAQLALAKAQTKPGMTKPGQPRDVVETTEDIVSVFSTDMTERQVPARFVKKNPFVFPVFEPVTAGDVGAVENEDRTKKDRLRVLQREIDQLQLQSIMQGSRPVAIISGQLVQPGQSVGSFTVKSVGHLSVDLEIDGKIFTLRMDQPGDPRGGGSSGSFRR